jgi:hypothetical protein
MKARVLAAAWDGRKRFEGLTGNSGAAPAIVTRVASIDGQREVLGLPHATRSKGPRPHKPDGESGTALLGYPTNDRSRPAGVPGRVTRRYWRQGSRWAVRTLAQCHAVGWF